MTDNYSSNTEKKTLKFSSLPLDTLPLLRYNTRMNKTPRMTRAHYNFLADFINSYALDLKIAPTDHVILAARMEAALKGTNPNYNSPKFYEAATKDLHRSEQDAEEALTRQIAKFKAEG